MRFGGELNKNHPESVGDDEIADLVRARFREAFPYECDLIYQMRGMIRADHKFFKSHGQYDFLQKKWPTSLAMYLVGWMMGNKKLKAKMGNKLNED